MSNVTCVDAGYDGPVNLEVIGANDCDQDRCAIIAAESFPAGSRDGLDRVAMRIDFPNDVISHLHPIEVSVFVKPQFVGFK